MTQKGFTLIELLVVVAIIGVLVAVGVVAFNGFINTSKINATKQSHNVHAGKGHQRRVSAKMKVTISVKHLIGL